MTMTQPAGVSIFEQLEKIGAEHRRTGALPDSDFDAFYDLLRPVIDTVCGRLRLTPFQATLFGDIIVALDGAMISVRTLAQHIGCAPVKMFKFWGDVTAIEERGLLTLSDSYYSGGEIGKNLWVSVDLIQDLCATGDSFREAGQALSVDEFFVELCKLCEHRVQKKWNFKRCFHRMQELFSGNREFAIVKAIVGYDLSPDDTFMLLRFCHYAVNRDQNEMSFSQLEGLYDHESDFLPVKQKLRAKKHRLQELGLVDRFCENSMAKADLFCLTDKAKAELLSELTLFGDNDSEALLLPDKIAEKELFYPRKTAAQIDELTSIFSAERFVGIQESLAGAGMRTGFACLFSGGPGTGKTETALQLARRTGRTVFRVDIADTKSMWFGESEKRIKQVFTRYQRVAKNAALAPILLFNEADAVIGKRQNLDGNARGPAQTENAIQNIILEQLENLTGILIATTNLAANMDSAFERRFLYKVDFEKPTAETRKNIWRSQLKQLSGEDAAALAARFEFSGGQIENIARKAAVFRILHGEAPPLAQLIAYCKDEATAGNNAKPIGFSCS